jgi:hypothetical protein
MAFFRFTRDKRGYQHFYLVEPVANRRGKVRQRVLYWFRSPPDIKVGREPFDESVRRALEAQNPNVTFDWAAILDAPLPSPDADMWRERRRAERAAKQATAASTREEDADQPEDAGHASDEGEAAPVPSAATEAAPVASSAEQLRKKRRRRRGKRPSTEPVAMESEAAADGAPVTEQPPDPPESPED